MAIRTGADKRKRARDRRKGDPAGGLAPNAVPQFAPNFTVYLLPPEAVCLYSEDRKFFLHGELYSALAAAIGTGRKSVRELVRGLEQKFPSDKIDEALNRLLDRRYIVLTKPKADGIVAAYWASLGLPPDTAAKNLRGCRVRVEAIDVNGAKELGAALTGLGVRVVKGAADLIVVLVNDYLEGKLVELNRRHVADRTPWLLVQPAGVSPLVGPVFRAGKGACWNCLFDRMIRNREIRGFLNRAKAQPVAVSPLARSPLGDSAIQLAAVEIAKAISTEFRTDLNEHIISLDLSGASVVKHYVAARPQCAVCGSKELRDPGRAPVPVELAAGAKLLVTSGGHRTVSSRATVARFRKHVSPLSGVVSRLERMDSDLPMNNSYFAAHNFSGPARTVDDLRNALSGGAFGKGATAEQGEASALMEAIERYSGVYQGDEIRIKRKLADFPSGEAIHPNDVMLYSDAQFLDQASGKPDSEALQMHARFDPAAEVEWTPAWSLRDQCFRYLPTGLMYFFHRGPDQINADSNGCAAGNTLEEAIVQGFLELVERDAYAIWWYNRLRRPQLDLGRFDDSYIGDLKAQFESRGRKLWVLDVTTDLGIPTYVAIAHWMQNRQENIEFGSGAHFDTRIALLRALTELNQFLSIGVMGGGTGEKSTLDGLTPLRLRNYPFLTPRGKTSRERSGAKFGRLDTTRNQVEACVAAVKRLGLDFLVLDQTRPDIGVPVARVIVPGMRHFYRRFGPGRLYDIPVKLKWLDRPRAENELTQFLPHT